MSLQFVLSKLFRGAVTLLLAVTFVFIVLRVSGDPTEFMLGDDATPETIVLLRERLGLDQSYLHQYVNYVAAMVQGDFGYSFRDGRPAAEVIAERVPQTLLLGATALLITLAIGIPAGVMAALKRGSWVDRLT